MNLCPDAVAAELKKRQKRQQIGRRRGLERRAAKVPLLADLVIERELAERAAYFAAEPGERDRQIVEFRLAMAGPKPVSAAQIDEFLTQPYALSGIEFSYCALAYRAFAERVLPPLAIWKAKIRYARLRESFHSCQGTHYHADHWHQVLVDAGYRREAWEISANHSDDPAKEMEFYERTWGTKQPKPQAAPVQLALDLATGAGG